MECGQIAANGKKGRLDINGYGLDNRSRYQGSFGEYVEYYIKTVTPRSGDKPFDVAHVLRRLTEKEYMRILPVLHIFENVKILIIISDEFRTIQADGGEDRWMGNSCRIYDNRFSKRDIGTVTVREGFITIDSAENQHEEPTMVLDIVGYQTNTKNRMYYYRFDEMEYSFVSQGGHANIRYYSVVVVAKYGTKIAENDDMGGGVLKEYPHIIVEDFDIEVRKALSHQFPWISENMNSWEGYDDSFMTEFQLDLKLNDVEHSGTLTFHVCYDHERFVAYRHEFTRLSELRKIFDNLSHSSKLIPSEREYKKRHLSSTHWDKPEKGETLSIGHAFFLEHQKEIETFGCVVKREISDIRYNSHVGISYDVFSQDGQVLHGNTIHPLVFGFPIFLWEDAIWAKNLLLSLFPNAKIYEQTEIVKALEYNEKKEILRLLHLGWSKIEVVVDGMNDIYIFNPVIDVSIFNGRITKRGKWYLLEDNLKVIPKEMYHLFS